MKMKQGNWYVYKNDGQENCKECSRKNGRKFLYNEDSILPPLHPNCCCYVQDCNAEMEEMFKAHFPTISNKWLDELMQCEYYQYEDIAVPNYISNDGIYYYKVGNEVYHAKLETLNAIGRLPDGRYILGNGEYTKNLYLYQNIKDLEEKNKFSKTKI
ncbi:MAG: hypothetical protein RR185_00235 [Angelakisella sp.]